jgi:hypothetical protein
VVVGGPPFQNPTNALDVTNDGFIAPIDALLIINFLNFYGRLIPGQNIPLPPTSPPFPPPAPVIDPTGGGVPGQARYLDVDGNGFLTPSDAILVINYLNSAAFRKSLQQAQGEGEGASAFAAAAAPAAASDPSIPVVLYATSGVEFEVRDRQSSASSAVLLQDQALAAVRAELGPIAPPALAAPMQAAKDQATDELEWDDLLSDLAYDQKSLSK